jgi:arylamine N-acetyltransferase
MGSDVRSPTFTTDQLSAYFNHIQLPHKYHALLKQDGGAVPRDLSLLTALHVHQIAAIPYENLSLHYSPIKTVILDPQHLFQKFVADGRNRGGYCMEGSLFFLHVLRSLGFDVYPTGARMRPRQDGVPAGDFTGLVHIVLIVTLSEAHGGGKYVCDVAFGGDGPTMPLLLIDGWMTTNLGTQEVRYIRAPIGQVQQRVLGNRQKYWIYQYRNSADRDWNSFYCFDETEFLEADFDVMNFYTSQGRTFQRVMVLAIKFLRAEGSPPRIGGKVMLVNGVVKRNTAGKTEVVRVCKTEEERIKALKDYFNIDLTVEERNGITGEVTELKDADVIEK